MRRQQQSSRRYLWEKRFRSAKTSGSANCLQNRLLDMIEEEIRHAKRGEEAYIGVKMNSLTDKKLMDKLIEASQAGVEIELICTWNLLPYPGSGRVYRKHPGHQYCRTFFGTFQNLYIWKRRKTENLYSICRLDDKKYGT